MDGSGRAEHTSPSLANNQPASRANGAAAGAAAREGRRKRPECLHPPRGRAGVIILLYARAWCPACAPGRGRTSSMTSSSAWASLAWCWGWMYCTVCRAVRTAGGRRGGVWWGAWQRQLRMKGQTGASWRRHCRRRCCQQPWLPPLAATPRKRGVTGKRTAMRRRHGPPSHLVLTCRRQRMAMRRRQGQGPPSHWNFHLPVVPEDIHPDDGLAKGGVGGLDQVVVNVLLQGV